MPKAERREETSDEQTGVRPVACRKCRDEGWWLDENKWFHYCDCKAGIRVREEDEGGD